jgi:DNA-binding GntR family transcriptional regulator
MPEIADYARIAQEIERSIRSGGRKPQSKLPTLLELKKQYDVSDTTIKYALVWLESRHLIIRRQGKGVYISDPATWLIDPQA